MEGNKSKDEGNEDDDDEAVEEEGNDQGEQKQAMYL